MILEKKEFGNSLRVTQILHQVNSLYVHSKRAIIFDDRRLGLENKFYPNKITQYGRGLTILKKKKKKNLPKTWAFKASKSQILCAVCISNKKATKHETAVIHLD